MKYIRKIERVERVKFMSNWEEYVRTVEPYVPGEQTNQPDMIKLNTNENPYPPAPGVVEALKNFDTDKLRLYPEPTCKVLVDAIADYYGIRSSQVFTGVGSDDVLAMIFMTFFNSKKPILFPDITSRLCAMISSISESGMRIPVGAFGFGNTTPPLSP